LVSFDPNENIVLWAWANHRKYRRTYEDESKREQHATWIRLRSPQDGEAWLSQVARNDE
jgi:hypothetical protein